MLGYWESNVVSDNNNHFRLFSGVCLKILVPSIAPSAWGILQTQPCLLLSIAFAVSNSEIENFINWGDNLNISIQSSRVIVTAVDFAMANVFETSVMLCFLYFDLAWNSSIHKYSLIKAKLQLHNNDPNIKTKNKNDLKHFLYYNYKFFV